MKQQTEMQAKKNATLLASSLSRHTAVHASPGFDSLHSPDYAPEGGSVAPEVEQAIRRARGSGQALDMDVRAQMERAFGADFSRVRVHTDDEAGALNRALDARAFTTGEDIFFRQGAYDPGSSSSRELLAHELTHVVQQNGSQVHGRLAVDQPGNRYEQEAHKVARAVIRREVSELEIVGPYSISTLRSDSIQREERAAVVESKRTGESRGQIRSWCDPYAKDQLVAQVFFPTDVDSLDAHDEEVLSDLKTAFEPVVMSQKVLFAILGYADYRGTEKHNKGLSQRRADHVRDFLHLGPLSKSSNFSAYPAGMGESEAPQNIGASPKELQLDRRVDVYSTYVPEKAEKESVPEVLDMLDPLLEGVGEVKRLRPAPDLVTELGKHFLGTLIGLIPGVGGMIASQVYGFYGMIGVEVPGEDPAGHARMIIGDAIQVHLILAEDNLIRKHVAKTQDMRETWEKAAIHHFNWAVNLVQYSKALEGETTFEGFDEFAEKFMESFKRLDNAAREHVKRKEEALQSPWWGY